MGERYWEVDAIRGVSLIGMVIFHLISLLVIFHMIVSFEFYASLTPYVHLGTSIFVIISGVALILRYGRMAGKPLREYHLAIIKRGLLVFFIGLMIAVVGSILIHFFIGDGRYMYFNFLQMMGLSMILCIPFLRIGKWSIIPALFFILLGFFMGTINGPEWMMIFGIYPTSLYPRDFFPLLPWFGVMLLGVWIGSVIYPKGVRTYKIREPKKFGSLIATIGKYPLEIYLLHIPILFALLWIIMTIAHLAGIPFGYL